MQSNTRVSSTPSGGRSNSFLTSTSFDAKAMPTMYHFSSQSLSRSSSLSAPRRPQRANTSPAPPRAPWTGPKTSAPSRSHTPTIPLSHTHTQLPPARPKTPVAADRPSLARKPSVLLPSFRPNLPLPNYNPSANNSSSFKEATKKNVRAEMLHWVEQEVESISREAEEVARRSFNSLNGPRSEKRKRKDEFWDPGPEAKTKDDLSEFRYPKRTQSRRGSLDSIFRDEWTAQPDAPAPRKAKDWEKWAEDKVRTKRRLEEAWKKEEHEFVETENLVRESQAREDLRREREASKDRERKRFMEMERQRAAREEVIRLAEQERARQIHEALAAEALRQERLEKEIRRVEEEARRLEAELFARERERQRQEREQKQRRQQSRSSSSSSRQRAEMNEHLRRAFEAVMQEDLSDIDTEWERFATAFKLNVGRNERTGRTEKKRYQSPAESFLEAWEMYERRWSQLSAPHPAGNSASSAPRRLGFADIPWPVLRQPTRAADVASQLTESSIASFILSPFHSSSTPHHHTTSTTSTSPDTQGRMRKSRLREALLRWHPDKMARVIACIDRDEERAAVKEGAESVARHLNALMAVEV